MRSYLICDARSNETPCVYCETSLRKLRSDPPRCIKHGNILFTETAFNGLDRREIRKQLAADRSVK
jgi:hypothetical protein